MATRGGRFHGSLVKQCDLGNHGDFMVKKTLVFLLMFDN